MSTEKPDKDGLFDAVTDFTNFSFNRKKWSDTTRVIGLFTMGLFLNFFSYFLTSVFNEPAMAYVGGKAAEAFWMMAAFHVVRRVLWPYVNLKEAWFDSKKDPLARSVYVLGIFIVFASLLMFSSPSKASVPEAAKKVIPELVWEGSKIWPDADFATLAAQIHRETCPSETHRFCFSPTARAKTAWEEGIGLGQFTRTAKMDVVSELRAQFPEYLADWGWDRNLQNSRYQIQAFVLKNRYNWSKITGTKTREDHEAMMLIGYNAGLGRVSSDRKICKVTPGCDPDVWFGNVELTSRLKNVPKMKEYRQTFFEINRSYAETILKKLKPRYRQYLDENKIA